MGKLNRTALILLDYISWPWLLIIIFLCGWMQMAAVGKPQAIMSSEEMAEKEANRTGKIVSLRKSSSNAKNSSRSLAAIGSTNGTTKSRSRRSFNSQQARDDELVIDEESMAGNGRMKRWMILPFEPLSISFDDVSYYVDMPAVFNLMNGILQA
jgi:hypothetical protein